tara:strand:+ start:319 stop:555 length:237 start_codon:yes stop_codon:yes gene_type:complete
LSKFLEAMRDSGIIQKLREGLSDEEKEQFDDVVKKTIQEYSGLWADVEPLINKYHGKVNNYVEKPESKQRRNDESNDE